MSARERTLPLICLTLAMIIWASSFVALKLAFRHFDPLWVIFGRMAVGSVGFLCLFPLLRGNDWRRGDLKYLLCMSFCEPCLYFLCEAGALQHTSASQAGMITTMLPLFVAGGAALFLGECITRRTLSGFACAMVGAGVLSLAGSPTADAPNPVLGNFLELCAMVCAACYTIILKRLSSRYNPFFLTACQAFVGALFYLPLLFLPTTVAPVGLDLPGIMSIVYLGLVVTIGAYGMFNFGVSRIPVSQAGAFINLIPVFTLIMSWIILGERFTGLQFVASALVFFGVWLSQDGMERVEAQE